MTENRVTERSLSALYRASVRRDAAGADADDLQALVRAGEVDAAVLERLARTPDAVAVHGIARVLPPWANALAGEIQRASSSQDAATSRVRNWGWVSLAAAAGLAVCVVGLRQRGPSEAMPEVAVQAAAAATPDDVLFSEPDAAMLASAPAVTGDSIFTDSLDAAPLPRDS